jgi:hypothetical protein
MTSAKLIVVTLALTLLPKACGKKDEPIDAGPAAIESAATPTATDTAATPSTTATATNKPVVKPALKDAAAGDAAISAAGDAGAVADAGSAAAAGDAGGKKGFLPPKVDAPPGGNKDEKGTAFGRFDQAALIQKVHTRDPMLEVCYKATGKDPGEWDTRCYEMAFTPDGLVTGVTTKSQDALAACTRAALTGLPLGAPKDKAAGQARVCLSTR